MNWWINSSGWLILANNGRRPNEGSISNIQFEFLTGKKINWDIRKEKYILTIRKKGHLRVYDKSFIIGELYKNNYRTYKCEHVDREGTALLIPLRNTFKAITTSDTTDWEIA